MQQTTVKTMSVFLLFSCDLWTKISVNGVLSLAAIVQTSFYLKE